MARRILALPVLALALVVTAPTAAAPQTITVKEKNFKIVLSAKPKAGKVKFVVVNTSSLPHDFKLKGGGKTLKTPIIAGGGKAALRATLKKGVKYTFWCGVSGHAAAGMKGTFVAR